MARYRVNESVTAEVNHFMHGTVQASFSAGDVEPHSEQEQLLLDHLVATGHASVIEADPPGDPEQERWVTPDDNETEIGETGSGEGPTPSKPARARKAKP